MDKNGDLPLLIRILGTLGELEGYGIFRTTLFVSAAVMISAILIYQGYVGWTILILGILLFLVFFPRRKSQFQTIKRKYGITMKKDKGDVGSKTTSHLRKKKLKNQSCAFILLGQSR